MSPETRLEALLREVERKPTEEDLKEIRALRKILGIADTDRVWTTLVSATFDRSLLRAELAKNTNLLARSVNQATGALAPAVEKAVHDVATRALAQQRLGWNVASMAICSLVTAFLVTLGAYYGSGLQTAVSRKEIVFVDLAFLLTGPIFFTVLIVSLVMWSFISYSLEYRASQVFISSAAALILSVAFFYYVCAPYIPGSMFRPCDAGVPYRMDGDAK